MLFIGDIHISARYKDFLINNLKDWILSQNDKNIIFLGDYVYHFSYNRNSLLKLFNLFLELVNLGKNVYIISGNHDWLSQNFVFQEAENLLKKLKILNQNNFQIITTPELFEIENYNFLFFPFNLKFYNEEEINSIKNFIKKNISTDKKNTRSDVFLEIYETALNLLESKNKNEQISGQINLSLLKLIIENQNKNNLVIIHHHYIANTSFPGQKAKFSYNSIALSEKFLEIPNISLLAGHLHQSFVFKNFLCVGSIWHTNPTEFNHYKYLFKLENNILKIHNFHINPYLIISDQQLIDESFLKTFLEDINKITQKKFTDNIGSISLFSDINFINSDLPKISQCTITIKTNTSYQQINSIIDENLQKQLKDFKLKIPLANIDDLTQKLEISGKNLGESLNDRKELLKKYIISKYKDQSDKYFDLMSELGIL